MRRTSMSVSILRRRPSLARSPRRAGRRPRPGPATSSRPRASIASSVARDPRPGGPQRPLLSRRRSRPRARPEDGRGLRPVPDGGRGSPPPRHRPIPRRTRPDGSMGVSDGISSPGRSIRRPHRLVEMIETGDWAGAAAKGPLPHRRPGGAGPGGLRGPAPPRGSEDPRPQAQIGRTERPEGGHAA